MASVLLIYYYSINWAGRHQAWGGGVQGDPFQDRPLEGHRTEDGEDELHHDVRLERPVDEQPVVADGDAQSRQEIHAQQEPQIDRGDAPSPEASHGNRQADHG